MNGMRLVYLTYRLASRPPIKIASNLSCLRRNFTIGPCLCEQQRQISSVEAQDFEKEETLMQKIVKKIPGLDLQKGRMMGTAYILYENIADKVDYANFFEQLDLPDTFYSWFVVTELHIWMLSARSMAEGSDGKHVRNYMVEALWSDVGQRIKQLGENNNPAVARKQIQEMSEQLQASLIAYDEGLQSDDTVLAGALWRRFYQYRDVEMQHLELLVRYVRKQMRLLDHLSKEKLFKTREVNWISLK